MKLDFAIRDEVLGTVPSLGGFAIAVRKHRRADNPAQDLRLLAYIYWFDA